MQNMYARKTEESTHRIDGHTTVGWVDRIHIVHTSPWRMQPYMSPCIIVDRTEGKPKKKMEGSKGH